MKIFLSSLAIMSLPSLFAAFPAYLQSSEFRALFCHADAAQAFNLRRKLRLPAFVAVILSGMRKCVQTELDEFFAHLQRQAQLVRHISEQAFAKALTKLASHAIAALDDWLQLHTDQAAFVPRWHGLRLVAPGFLAHVLRATCQPRDLCHHRRTDRSVCISKAGMMLAASLHDAHENERQILFEHLDQLSSGDLLLLDHAFSRRCLEALLKQRGIIFCLRVKRLATPASLACATSCAPTSNKRASP